MIKDVVMIFKLIKITKFDLCLNECHLKNLLKVSEEEHKVHQNKFDYSSTKQFKSQRDKVKIICPHHGEIKTYNVGNHLEIWEVDKPKKEVVVVMLKGLMKIFLQESQIKGFIYDLDMITLWLIIKTQTQKLL